MKDAFTSKVPYQGEQGTIITDVVPEGLQVDISSISHGGTYDPITRTITWDLSNEDEGSVTVEFTTTAKQEPKLFENTADITYFDDTGGVSNTTYHKTAPPSVTEFFRELDNETNVLDDTLDGNVVELTTGDPYSPDPGIPPETIIKNGVTYIYVGYRIDNGVIDTTPHDSLPGVLISSVTNHVNVTYLYEQAPETSLKFYKVDESDNPLEGVKFLLYACSDEDPSSHNHPWLVTDESSNCWGDAVAVFSEVDGLVEFSELSPGSYMLVEVETLPGYQLPLGQWLIEVDDTFEITITAHGIDSVTLPPAFKFSLNGENLLLPNYQQMVMPMAGGGGLVTLTVLGVVLLADGIIFAILPGRKERRQE